MNRVLLVSVVVILAGCATACGSSSKKSSTPSAVTNTAATTVPAYGGAGSSPTLQVAMNANLHQNIMTDSTGKTVYIYVPDGSSTTSKVPVALQARWPEVSATMTSTPSVGTGLNANKLAVNGAHQVSYNRHLLYTFTGDARAGDTNGQGLGNIWYAISPSGTPII